MTTITLMRQRRRQEAGLTKVEVLAMVAMVAVLIGLLLPGQPRPLSKAKRISCVNNLKQIGLAFRVWANDAEEGFPTAHADRLGGVGDSMAEGKVWRAFQVMSNMLFDPKILVCPADTRIAATNWNDFGNANLSYFVGLDAADTRPNMILAGDRNLARDGALLSGIVTLGTNSPLTWTRELHKGAGNVALADGSVQQLTSQSLRQLLVNTGDTTNRVLFPQ